MLWYDAFQVVFLSNRPGHFLNLLKILLQKYHDPFKIVTIRLSDKLLILL
jgi:hypothetical protein